LFRRFSVNFAILSMLLDGIMVVLSLAVAAYLRPSMSALSFVKPFDPTFQLPWPLYPLFAFGWVGILLLLSVYDGRRNLRGVDEFANLTLGFILATVSMAGALYLSYRVVSRSLFLVFVLMAYGGMIAWRLAIRIAFPLGRGWDMQQRRVMIVGAGPVGRNLHAQINRFPNLGLSVVGFLDDDQKKRTKTPDILGTVDQARQIIREYDVQDVVIALPGRAYERINYLIAELHSLPVKVWVIPDYFHLALHKAEVVDFADIPMLDLRAPALNDYQRMLKRIFDLAITLLVTPLALLLFLIIALAIRLEGPGPVLFKQKRVGENGRLFEMVKFRSMVTNAEQLRVIVECQDPEGHLIHKTPQDPRVTRVGRILRRTSLDELPQLWNILKGEMSLVGPRPELPYLVDRYEPWQHKRFAVPPGITGWWQVNGRSDKPMHLHTEDDLYYVQHYSILLDLQILLKTVFVVLRGNGAF
jgi:exopolysaccharide biosynthesis polyprenyl glycosylphosphotransferase